MARLQGLIDQLEKALDEVDVAKATMETVRAATDEAIAGALAIYEGRKAAEVSTRKEAEAAHAESVRIAEALKAELRRDFDALMGSGTGGRVRQ